MTDRNKILNIYVDFHRTLPKNHEIAYLFIKSQDTEQVLSFIIIIIKPYLQIEGYALESAISYVFQISSLLL